MGKSIDLLVGLAFVAVVDMMVGYLTYSGLSKVLGLAPSVWHRVGVATLLGAALALSSPWIAQVARILR